MGWTCCLAHRIQNVLQGQARIILPLSHHALPKRAMLGGSLNLSI